MSSLQDLMDACQAQATWMEHSAYGWESYPTVPKSQYKGTCVTYVACVLQRLNILAPGKYIWHNARGEVTGANDQMTVKYPTGTLHQIKAQLQAGDIIMDGSGSDMGSGSHIFIITGQWNGNNPIVWDNHSGQDGWGAYEYTRNRNIIAVVTLFGVPFTPRLTRSGMLNNPYWYSRNPLYLAGYGLPNCTCYAWGRFWEIGDPGRQYINRPTLSTGNAEDWYEYTADGYQRGSTPQLGAVACWADGPYSGDGHVAIVEQINADGSIVCSNSAYGGEYFYCNNTTEHPPLQPPDYLPEAGYVFQGFIYNPYTGGGPSPGPGPGPTGDYWWMLKRALWHREEDILK